MAELSFGDWLKHRRLGLGLTQDQLALQINCSTSALRKFESEERRPSAETINQLAVIFNIPPEERKSFLRFARGDWQAYVDDVTDRAPWRLSKTDQQTNLPSFLTSFIGREKEQRKVISLLKKNRLVTLVGAGGMGKTRLAIQVGQQLLQAYLDGVWFFPLDLLSDPLRVPQTVASVFGIQEGLDRQVIDTLIYVLHKKTSLLIFDNCEHLLDSCATLIRTLLFHCPNLRILTTSRETLKVEGEATYYLSSLSIPKENESLEKIAGYESIQLFVDRAEMARTTFQLLKDNARAIADICRRLDGIPMAIELIVARVNIMTVEEISKRLHESFAILEINNRTTLSRHQTLRASMDWSWSLLTYSEQVFLCQLSVFVGGWTLESAQSVCDGNALDLTDSLARKSLIVVEQEREHGTRYHFHEFLRQYAYEKLIMSGELETISLRHLKYFLNFSEEIELGLRGKEQEQWYDRAIDERDNLNAALEQAAKKDVEAGLYIVSRLQVIWKIYDIRRGSFWLTEFLECPESKKYPIPRAKALCTQGWILFWLDIFIEALGPAEESLALFTACNDQKGKIESIMLLGTIYYYELDQTEGIKLYQQALTLSQSLGDIWLEAKTYLLLGDEHCDQRSFDYWDRAVKLFNEAGDRRSQAEALSLIGHYRVLNGDVELAPKYLDEAAKLIPLERHSDVRGRLQIAKSIIARLGGDYDQAYTLLQDALASSEKLGNQYESFWITVRLGFIALLKGNIKEAQEIFIASAEVFQKNRDKLGVVFSIEGMAGIFGLIGSPLIAARLIGWADATRKEIEQIRPRVEQNDIDKIVAEGISSLGKDRFMDAYHKGWEIKLNEAIDLALKKQ